MVETLEEMAVEQPQKEVKEDFFKAEPKYARDEKLSETGYCVECHACNSGCYMCQF
jgi:heterodisulfide reductase subunit C